MAANIDVKLLRQTKFPPEFSRKVDMTKVNIEVMKKWIAGRISEILGSEDDVVIELCFNLLEGSRFPDIKALQIQLTGFLDKDTSKFCKELWSLCLSGQENPQGVPKELLEAKKLELIQEKIEAEKAAEAARRQQEQERAREREIEELRRRGRGDRARGGRGGGRGGRDFDRRGARGSLSPPPRYRSQDRYRGPPPRREFDSYVPSGSRRGRRPSGSPSYSRSPSRSPSRSRPPRRQRHEGRGQRRRSYSRSVSPDRWGHRRPRRRSPDYGDRAKSIIRSDSSRSRTPRRDRSRRRSVSSRSVSSSPQNDRRRRYSSDSRSLSRSPSRSRGRHGSGRKSRDAHRLSRSRDRRNDRRRRSPSGSRSRSRSRSPRKEGRARRRSLERYQPAARRRRDPSSVSAPGEKRRKMADEDEDSTRRPSRPTNSEDKEMKDADENVRQTVPTQISSTELREKLLREKLVAMRRSSSGKSVGDASKTGQV